MSGDLKSLGIAEHSLRRESADKILVRMVPARLPGWTVEIYSTHRKEENLRHLLLKWAFERLNQREIIVLKLLSLNCSKHWFLIIKFLLKNLMFERYLCSELIHRMMAKELLPTDWDPLRTYYGYKPSVAIHRLWTEVVRIPPKRFIGVGHSDHGMLSSTPSWKEQQLPDGEMDSSKVRDLQKILRSLTAKARRLRKRNPTPGNRNPG